MKIKVSTLTAPLTVTVTGTEDWLNGIYENFPAPKGAQPSFVKAQINLRPDEYGRVEVQGQFEYQPFLSCSRCADMIPWAISQSFTVSFRPEPSAETLEKEVDLQAEDLDIYYFEDAAINLEELLNDLIQTSIPSQVIPKSADGKNCAVCLETLSDGLIYESETTDDDKTNPFAVLKNLKLPE